MNAIDVLYQLLVMVQDDNHEASGLGDENQKQDFRNTNNSSYSDSLILSWQDEQNSKIISIGQDFGIPFAICIHWEIYLPQCTGPSRKTQRSQSTLELWIVKPLNRTHSAWWWWPEGHSRTMWYQYKCFFPLILHTKVAFIENYYRTVSIPKLPLCGNSFYQGIGYEQACKN